MDDLPRRCRASRDGCGLTPHRLTARRRLDGDHRHHRSRRHLADGPAGGEHAPNHRAVHEAPGIAYGTLVVLTSPALVAADAAVRPADDPRLVRPRSRRLRGAATSDGAEFPDAEPTMSAVVRDGSRRPANPSPAGTSPTRAVAQPTRAEPSMTRSSPPGRHGCSAGSADLPTTDDGTDRADPTCEDVPWRLTGRVVVGRATCRPATPPYTAATTRCRSTEAYARPSSRPSRTAATTSDGVCRVSS